MVDAGAPELGDFLVVARAPAAAHLAPDTGIVVSGLPGAHSPLVARLSTQWEDIGLQAPQPRELRIAVTGRHRSIDEAMAEWGVVAQLLGTILGFSSNVNVGRTEVYVALDTSPGVDERPFLQVQAPNASGPPLEGRMARPGLFMAVARGIGRTDHFARLARAMAHYDLALERWSLSTEALCLSYLYIAAENLTKACLRARCEEAGQTEEELAVALGIRTTGDGAGRWRGLLDARIRLDEIFGGDQPVYTAAKRASDGIEHGFLDFVEVQRQASYAVLPTFRYLRGAILELIPLPHAERSDLLALEPRDVTSTRKVLRGRFIGPGAPTPDHEQFPHLDWTSNITRQWWEGDTLRRTVEDTFKVQASPGVTFRAEHIEVQGRHEHGRAIGIQKPPHVFIDGEAVPPDQVTLIAGTPAPTPPDPNAPNPSAGTA